MVPGSIVKLSDVFAYDGPHSQHIEKEKRRLTGGLSKGVGDHIFNVITKKTEFKSSAISKYSHIYQKVLPSNQSIETKLRILRSYRLKLLHEYCRDVMKGAYSSCIVFQTLMACRELRRKSVLFPKETKLFRIG
jgi:hypothetical protein